MRNEGNVEERKTNFNDITIYFHSLPYHSLIALKNMETEREKQREGKRKSGM